MTRYHVFSVCSLCVDRWQGDLLVFKGSQRAESNTSQLTPNTTGTQLYIKGFISLGLSIIGFGSSLVPIKRTETGDGEGPGFHSLQLMI